MITHNYTPGKKERFGKKKADRNLSAWNACALKSGMKEKNKTGLTIRVKF